MDHHLGEKHMFNAFLAKFLGIDKVLNPKSVKLSGYNIYHVVFVPLILYVVLISAVTCFNGMYYWTNHRTEAILYFGIAETCLFSCYKMWIIICRSRQIWECLTITRFDFASCDHHRDEGVLKEWRNRIIRITNVYAIAFVICSTLFVLSPMVFINGQNTMKNRDRSTVHYRLSVINLYAMLPAETYNTYFNTMYFVEASCIYVYLLFLITFDTLLITFCLAFSCQLQIIIAALNTSGPKRIVQDAIQNDNDEEIESNVFYSLKEHHLTYKDLITIIKNHQSIIKKFENFFSIFQYIMLSQIFASTYAIVSIWINLSMNFVDGNYDSASKSMLTKVIAACPVIVFQLYMTCYLFEYLHNKKESITLALYSSNWIEMDIKCKKLILLAMRMNTAHKLQLKFSQLRVVNSVMFFGTMRVCYSVLSMMMKYGSNKTRNS